MNEREDEGKKEVKDSGRVVVPLTEMVKRAGGAGLGGRTGWASRAPGGLAEPECP